MESQRPSHARTRRGSWALGLRGTALALSLALATSCVTTDVEPRDPRTDGQRAMDTLMTGADRIEVGAGPESPWQALLVQYDQDQNGELLSPELPNRNFQRFDRNEDGRITLADFPAESGEVSPWLYERLERKSANRLLSSTFSPWPPVDPMDWVQRFRDLDTNADLRLSRLELSPLPGTPSNARRDRFFTLLDLVDSNQNDEVDWLELEAYLSKTDPNS
jgi:Ca2+-binding EF-hand superfamily protein